MAWSSVVLPAPLGPKTPMNSPGRIAALTSESTTRPARASVARSSSMAFTLMDGPPRLWLSPLRCPQKRGRNSRLGAALRRSSASKRAVERVELRGHPFLVALPLGFGFRNRDDGHTSTIRERAHAFGQRLSGLHVVEKDLDRARPQVLFEGCNRRRARLGTIHHGKLKAAIAHGEPQASAM